MTNINLDWKLHFFFHSLIKTDILRFYFKNCDKGALTPTFSAFLKFYITKNYFIFLRYSTFQCCFITIIKFDIISKTPAQICSGPGRAEQEEQF